jgi:hypothetical protein
MAKNKREARKNLAKKVDTTVPVSIELLGTDKDPCFGKLNDPRHPICQRCGDIEICAIAMGQVNHVKRAIEEGKHAFKDIEEAAIPPGKHKKDIYKRIKEMLKQGKVSRDEIIKDVYGKYMSEIYTQKKIGRMLDFILKKYKKQILTKQNKYSWKKQSAQTA